MSDSELSTLERLKAPFPVADIEWRISRIMSTRTGPKATVLAYVTARAIMDRLDEVFGFDNWQSDYVVLPEDRIICKLRCRINGDWIEKQDGAQATQVEPFKGGISDALKRAAVPWGIGRYLYNLTETWVDIHGNKPAGVPGELVHFVHDKKENIKGYWVTPELPEFARPEGTPPRNFNVPKAEYSAATDSDSAPTTPKRQPSGNSSGAGQFRYNIPYNLRHLTQEHGLKARSIGVDEKDRKIWEQVGDFHEELRQFCKNPPPGQAVTAPKADDDQPPLESYGEPAGQPDDDDDIPF